MLLLIKLSELKPLAWNEIADVLESDTSLFSFRVSGQSESNSEW